MYAPNYRITGKVARALMSIEAGRQIVAQIPLTGPMLNSLRRTARLLSTHFSTQIEGNQLSHSQVQAVVEGEGSLPGHERDEAEVCYYFAALEWVESQGGRQARLAEKEIQSIHGLVMTSKPQPTPYRDSQNVIRDSLTGRTVYMPPEAKGVQMLMKELVRWVKESIAENELSVTVMVTLVHYQFATILTSMAMDEPLGY
jgi:Fic family protein